MQSSTTTSSKAEIIKPLLFKACVTLTLSFTAFICARIVAKRSKDTDSLNDVEIESSDSPSSTSSDIEDLRKREREIETRVVSYIDLKEQESLMLQQFRDVMLSEISRIDLIDEKVSLMEDESRRIEKFAVEYFRVLEKLDYWKSESGLLRRQVKKLLRRIRVQSSLVQEKDSSIRAKEAELSRAREELEMKNNVVSMLQDEASELRLALDRLKEEKNEQKNKLELEKTSSLSEIESDQAKLKMNQQTEIAELISLRRNNEHLENELAKIQEQYQENDHKRINCEIDLQENVEKGDKIVLGHNGNRKGFGNAKGDQACSISKKLLKGLRKWVEGCEKGKVIK